MSTDDGQMGFRGTAQWQQPSNSDLRSHVHAAVAGGEAAQELPEGHELRNATAKGGCGALSHFHLHSHIGALQIT